MRITNNEIHFDKSDMPLIKRRGLQAIIDEAIEFSERNEHPYIQDMYQLRRVLSVRISDINEVRTHLGDYYREFTISKNSGKSRKIYAPQGLLAFIQHRIKREILEHYTISQYAIAYHKGARLSDNVAPHCGKKYLLKLDLKDFFGHITYEKVYKNVFNSKHFPQFIGLTLTDFCCYKGHIPQGACTSPEISNIVMKAFDDIMGTWCEKNEIAYTRYSDDITFSSDKPLYAAYSKAKSLLESMGFELNAAKTKFLSSAQRQLVTGVVVNEKPNASSEYRRKLRQEVYYVLKYSWEDMIKDGIFYEDYGKYIMNLIGRIDYVLQLNPDLIWFRDARDQLQRMKFTA